MTRTQSWQGMSAALILGLAILSGCASMPAPEPADQEAMLGPWQTHRADMMALNRWTLEGRVGVRTADEGANFSVYWQQHREAYNIRLSGPLGQGGASISGGAGWAEMRTSDDIYYADGLNELVTQTTEFDLPLDLMQYWVRGIPAPHLRAGIRLDDTPLLIEMDQGGWTVKYTDYYPETGLPRRLDITRGRRSARIVIQAWDLGDA